jgi:hypothetical protein
MTTERTMSTDPVTRRLTPAEFDTPTICNAPSGWIRNEHGYTTEPFMRIPGAEAIVGYACRRQ